MDRFVSQGGQLPGSGLAGVDHDEALVVPVGPGEPIGQVDDVDAHAGEFLDEIVLGHTTRLGVGSDTVQSAGSYGSPSRGLAAGA